MTPKRRTQLLLLGGLALFALALCVAVVMMMLRRGPAVAY